MPHASQTASAAHTSSVPKSASGLRLFASHVFPSEPQPSTSSVPSLRLGSNESDATDTIDGANDAHDGELDVDPETLSDLPSLFLAALRDFASTEPARYYPASSHRDVDGEQDGACTNSILIVTAASRAFADPVSFSSSFRWHRVSG